jgi:inosine triphosphate pyrophosphatase
MQGATLEEIAIGKVEAAHRLLQAPVIVEDTALCFAALNGLPGAYVKWFQESIGPAGLARMLDGFQSRDAEAVCTIVYHK